MSNFSAWLKTEENSILDHNRKAAKDLLGQGATALKAQIDKAAQDGGAGTIAKDKLTVVVLSVVAKALHNNPVAVSLATLAISGVISSLDLSKPAAQIDAHVDQLVSAASARIDKAHF